MNKSYEKLLAEVLDAFATMNEEQRLHFLSLIEHYYCRFCGQRHPTDDKGRQRLCQCWNDE